MVDVSISAMLESKAKMYSHHHCLPNSNPGKIMHIFVANAQASTAFTLFQYERENQLREIERMSFGVSIKQY